MRRALGAAGIVAIVAASSFAATAQVGGKPVSGGNPTPGTPQPEPPNLADRITLSGCLQPAPASGSGITMPDPNTPSHARFVLTGAERVKRVPPDTGGSALATATSGLTYRLEGLDSQFSPFTNTHVEISGEIRPEASPAEGSGAPVLLVEFVQKIGARCT